MEHEGFLCAQHKMVLVKCMQHNASLAGSIYQSLVHPFLQRINQDHVAISTVNEFSKQAYLLIQQQVQYQFAQDESNFTQQFLFFFYQPLPTFYQFAALSAVEKLHFVAYADGSMSAILAEKLVYILETYQEQYEGYWFDTTTPQVSELEKWMLQQIQDLMNFYAQERGTATGSVPTLYNHKHALCYQLNLRAATILQEYFAKRRASVL